MGQACLGSPTGTASSSKEVTAATKGRPVTSQRLSQSTLCRQVSCASGTPSCSIGPGMSSPPATLGDTPRTSRLLGHFPRPVGPSVRPHTQACGPRKVLPLFVQGHSRGIQVGVLHGLHLWAPQEVVEGVEGVWGPGDGLGRLAGLPGGAGAWAQRAAALQVVHGAGNQVTWRGEKRHALSAPPACRQGDSSLRTNGSLCLCSHCASGSPQAEVGTATQTHSSPFTSRLALTAE